MAGSGSWEQRPRWVRLSALLFIILSSASGWWALAKFAGAL